jgi:hypothetical protein
VDAERRDSDAGGMDPIRHRDAEARGFSPHLLRTSWFVHPAAGVAQLASTADDLASTCRAVATVLSDDVVFTHVTSARLRGWWMPLIDDLPLVACSWRDAPHVDRRGVYVRRCGIPPQHRGHLDGVPVASAEWTIVELSEHLALLDLVAVIDSALHLGHTSVGLIRATMVRGRRGVRVLRRALDVVDGRSESWWESMLRLLHVLSGFEVEPQHVVRNAAGVEIARGDLLIVGTSRLAEFDGADHRERQQHQRDLRREKAPAREGIERYGYTATDLIHSPELVVHDAETARGLAHLPGRVGLWRAEAHLATISVPGQRALRGRLQRLVRTTSPRASGAKLPPSGANW